jgi:hypothetical protein
MAYLMTDMAAGSTAARQMQQNVYGAQYDQQNAQLANQQVQLQVQQEQANLERTKLQTLVADTSFKASEDSKTKLQQLAQSPEFKAADEAQRLRLMSSAQFAAGDVVNGAATLQSAEVYDAKKIATEAKKHALNDEAISKAAASIASLPDEKVTEFFDRLPAENKKAVIDNVGQENWDKYTGAEKKAVISSLLRNAKGQISTQMAGLATQRKMMSEDRADARAERRADLAVMLRTMSIDARAGKGEKAEKPEKSGFKEWVTAQAAAERMAAKQLAPLDKAVTEAEAAVKRSAAWFSGGSEKDAKVALGDAIKARDEAKVKHLKKEIMLLKGSGDFPNKDEFLDDYLQELAAYTDPDENKPKPPAAKATPAAPAASTLQMVPDVRAKTPVTGDTGIKGKVEASGQKYEPTKYDYRVAPDGSIQRRAK